MTDVEKVEVGKRRTDDGKFVQFGVIDGNAFHEFSTLRAGDYDEAQAAAAQTEPEPKGKK